MGGSNGGTTMGCVAKTAGVNVVGGWLGLFAGLKSMTGGERLVVVLVSEPNSGTINRSILIVIVLCHRGSRRRRSQCCLLSLMRGARGEGRRGGGVRGCRVPFVLLKQKVVVIVVLLIHTFTFASGQAGCV